MGRNHDRSHPLVIIIFTAQCFSKRTLQTMRSCHQLTYLPQLRDKQKKTFYHWLPMADVSRHG